MSSKLDDKPQKASKETNTNIRIMDAEDKKYLKEELVSSFEYLSTEENQEQEEEYNTEDGLKPASKITVSDGLTLSKSTSSRTSTEPESLIKIVDELITRLIFTTTWLKNAITSQEYKNKAIQTVRLLRSTLQSQYVRHIVQSIFNISGKLIKLTTNVNEANGTTNVLLEFLPVIPSSN